MFRGENCIDLLPEQAKKSVDIKPMPGWSVRREIFFRQPKQPHRRIHPAPILWVRRPRMLLLQMHESARRLDQTLEIICVFRSSPEPEMFEHVVRFVIALLVPATEKTDVTGMLRDLARRLVGRRAAQLRHQLGNSLAFVHGELSFGSAVMTGNPARILFQRRAVAHTAAAEG